MTRSELHRLVDQLPEAELAPAWIALNLLMEEDQAAAVSDTMFLAYPRKIPPAE